MSEATSRRKFLSGAAAAAAACTAACQSPTPATNLSPAATPAAPATAAANARDADVLSDADVATNYLLRPRYLAPGTEDGPHSAVLLYGLVCADFGEQELLCPHTATASGDLHEHHPKLWLKHDLVQTGSAPPDGQSGSGTEQCDFWNIHGLHVTVEALDASNQVIAAGGPDLDWRDSDTHPWTNRKWVRCLGAITNKKLLPPGARNNPTLVSARMNMQKGTITAIPPFNRRGKDTVWALTKFDNTDMVQATTDAMVWQRVYGGTVASYRIRLAPFPTGAEKVIRVKLEEDSQQLAAAVTHGLPEATTIANPNTLTDTKAFAKLLIGGDPGTHPVGQAAQNAWPMLMSSGSDGHCECACN